MHSVITDYVKPGKLKILFQEFTRFLGARFNRPAGPAAQGVWGAANPDKVL